MRKILRFFLVALCFCAVTNKAVGQFAGGNGTSGNPYQINTAAHLAQLASYVNAGNSTYNAAYYLLTANINLSSYDTNNLSFNSGKGWVPIGNQTYPFMGLFDGNGHVITGLCIKDWIAYGGLFGTIENAVIGNLGVDNLYVNVAAGAGGLVGLLLNSGGGNRIMNCYTTGTVICGGYFSSDTSSRAGGLIGQATYSPGIMYYTEIANCYSTCDVLTYGDIVGGLIGVGIFVDMESCYTTGIVMGEDVIGGLMGYSANNVIDGCAALNSTLNCPSQMGLYVGDLIGDTISTMLINNIAFDNMMSNSWGWGAYGAQITKQAINADATMGGRFTSPVWTAQNGSLPGLFGNTVTMPPHLALPVGGTPYITTTTLSSGKAGVSYNETLTATGTAPISWAVDIGSTLPAGLSLSTGGVLSGTPTAAGIYNFTVRASNSVGNDTKTLQLLIDFGGGNGVANPYIINVATELELLASLVNAGNANYNDKWYKLGSNISLSAYGASNLSFNNGNGWIPIGNPTNRFMGRFDGDGHIITGLYIDDASSTFLGLFGTGKDVIIENLGVDGLDITVGAGAGGLIGAFDNEGGTNRIKNCYTTGTITCGRFTQSNSSYAGGLIGFAGATQSSFTTVTGCYSTCDIVASGFYVGGLIGLGSNVQMTSCYATGEVTSADGVGGLIGLSDKSYTFNCAALNPMLSSPSGTYIGRIIGLSQGIMDTSRNIAFDNMGLSYWGTASSVQGRDTSKLAINSSATLGGRFTNLEGWTTQAGRLPGLFGNTVVMPPHLVVSGGNPPVIVTTTLPNGTVGTPYNEIITVTGDNNSMQLIHTSGNLPTGLSILSGAEFTLSGTPTTAGTFTFTLQATNDAGSDTKTLTITINNAGQAPVITTTTLPAGEIGVAYSQYIAATGTAPINWSLESGNMPNGLSLYGDGSISGMPTTEGSFNFTIKATNSAGSDAKNFTIIVSNVGIAAADNYHSLRVYPNPTRGQLTINNEELREGTVVEIYDVAGRAITNFQISTSNSQLNIDVSQVANGVYFLKMDNKVRRFVKE